MTVRKPFALLLASAGIAGAAARVSGQPAPVASPVEPIATGDVEIITIIDGPREGVERRRERALGDAPFVSVLYPDEHPAAASVADAVGTTAGAHSRSLGGLGAFSSITVRGAAPGHTAILFDGVPLARLATVTTDLGRFSLDAFGQVDLYRGAVPVELGGAGVGGALNLITRLGRGLRGERFTASVGGGSYGARHARLRYGDRHGRWLSSTTIGYQGATGDYDYFDNNSTLLNASDDHTETRRNNGFDAFDAATRWGTKDRSFVAGVRIAHKQQGLPGTLDNPSPTASLDTTNAIGDAAALLPLGGATVHGSLYALAERQQLDDANGELGLGATERQFRTVALGAAASARIAVGDHRAVVGGEGRVESFADRDRRGETARLTGRRIAGALTGAFDVVLGAAAALIITPAIRLDVMHSEPTPITSGPSAFAPVDSRRDVVPSPRLTARWLAQPDLSIKGSAGWYARLPTLIEVFGNRGYVIGTPDLRAERGPSGDLGVVWAPPGRRGALDRIFVEAAAFGHRADDTIALVTSGGYVARAANIGDTRAYGGELVAAARYAQTLSVTASYTRLVTEQLDGDPSVEGKQVPREPGHVLHARADVTRDVLGRRASLWLDASWQGTSFLDRANLGRVPARWLVGGNARVELYGGLAAALSVANALGKRVVQLPLDPPPSPAMTESPTALADVAGFPLPGRSFYLSLDWTH